MPKDGVLLPATGIRGHWFTAQYFATGDPGWLVPVQSMARVAPAFDLQAMKQMGVEGDVDDDQQMYVMNGGAFAVGDDGKIITDP